jgi:hypothetical protein
MKKGKKILITAACIAAALFTVSAVYVNDYYRALPEALEAADSMSGEDGNLFLDGSA